MKMKFYDVKIRKTIETEVVNRKEYNVKGQPRYAVIGKTSDGRSLVRFVKKKQYDEII